MRNKTSLFIIVLLLMSLTIPSGAAINPDAGTRAGAFLLIGPSARASGFGGAYTAVPGEAASIDWNPSGIAVMPNEQVSATYANWFADTKYGNIDIAMPIGKCAGLGLSYTYLDYGPMIRVTGQDPYGLPIEDGTFGASDMNLSLAYARKYSVFHKDLLAGVAFKTMRLAIDQDMAQGCAGDAGLSFYLDKNTVVGMAGRNFGSLYKIEQIDEQLAQEFDLGVSHKFTFGPSTLLAAVDGVEPIDDNAHFRGGLEYAYKEQLFVRAGYRADYDTDGFTTGLGIAYANMRFDYAYAPFNVLGDTQRITLTLFLGPFVSKAREPLNLTVKETGRTTATLAWDAHGNPGNTRYEIIQSKYETFNDTAVAVSQSYNLTKTSTVISGLSPDTDYWFKARAVGKNGAVSGYSNTAKGRTMPLPVFPVVQLSGTIVSTSSIMWQWPVVKDAVSYRIYDFKDNRMLAELQPSTSFWLESSLQENISYSRIVKVVTRDGEGPASNRADCVMIVNQPILFSGVGVSTSSIKWEWQDAKYVTSYRIYDFKDNRLLAELQANTSSWLEQSLEESTTYSRIIKVVNQNGEGPASNRADGVTLTQRSKR